MIERDEALPLVPKSALMTKTHYLMCPTCPNDVLSAGLVCTVVKGPNDPQRGSQTSFMTLALSAGNSSATGSHVSLFFWGGVFSPKPPTKPDSTPVHMKDTMHVVILEVFNYDQASN